MAGALARVRVNGDIPCVFSRKKLVEADWAESNTWDARKTLGRLISGLVLPNRGQLE